MLFETDNVLPDLAPLTSYPIASSPDFALNSFDANSYPPILFSDPTVDTAAIADFSTPISHDPASGLQWSFPSMISPQDLLGPLDEIQNPGLDFFAQDNSFMFPSTMGLYTPGLPCNNVLSLSTPADKAAKQRKLLEVMETARQLEAEIAAS